MNGSNINEKSVIRKLIMVLVVYFFFSITHDERIHMEFTKQGHSFLLSFLDITQLDIFLYYHSQLWGTQYEETYSLFCFHFQYLEWIMKCVII